MRSRPIAVIVALSLFVSPLAQAGNTSPLAQTRNVSPEVAAFVAALRNTKFAYRLSEEELHRAYLSDKFESGVDAAYQAQQAKADTLTGGGQNSIEVLFEKRAERQIQKRADEIVEAILNRENESQTNLELLSILHDFWYDDDARGPLKYIIAAIENNATAARKLKDLNSTVEHRAAEGISWGTYAVTAIIIGVEIIAFLATRSPRTAALVGETAPALERQAVRLSRIATVSRVAGQISAVVARTQLSQFVKTYGYVSLVKYSTMVVGGGAALDVGYGAVKDATHKETFDNTVANPADVRPTYEGFTVLNLVCRSFSLVKESERLIDTAKKLAAMGSSGYLDDDLMKDLRELNAVYTQFAALKHMFQRFSTQKVLLPPTITVDRRTGMAHMKVAVEGRNQEESFHCPKYQTEFLTWGENLVNDENVVGLPEVLDDVETAHQNLMVAEKLILAAKVK